MKSYNIARTKLVGGMSLRTIIELVSSFEKNDYTLKVNMKGHHERRWIVLHDDVWGKTLRDFVRTESVRKGKKNMTVKDFAAFVNNVVLPEAVQRGDAHGLPKKIQTGGISIRTARYWLHYMGCFFKQGRKDIYFDGHEREDVVEYRQKFVPRFLEYLDDPNIVLIIQDESIYRSNEYNNYFWQIGRPGEAINNVLRQKGMGYGTMVSGFITIDGFQSFTDAEVSEVNRIRVQKGQPLIKMCARICNQEVGGVFGDVDALTLTYCLFNYGKQRDGYWDSDKMVEQTSEVTSLLEYRYPGKKLVFIFDWSSGHDKKPVDSLTLAKLNLNFGGKQPVMRPTVVLENFAGKAPLYPPLKVGDVQHLTFQPGDPPPFYAPNLTPQEYIGQPKGAKQIAYERGLWKQGMVMRDDTKTMRSVHHVLAKCLDFQAFVKSILQEEIEAAGHCCDFLPKFHCELSPIERVWAKSKRYIRDCSDATRKTLLRNIPLSLWFDNISAETIVRYFGTCLDYAQSYKDGDSLLLAKMKKKKKDPTDQFYLQKPTCRHSSFLSYMIQLTLSFDFSSFGFSLLNMASSHYGSCLLDFSSLFKILWQAFLLFGDLSFIN